MIRLVLVFQMIFFFVAGTQVINHEIKVARAEAYANILLEMPVGALSSIDI